MFKKSSTSSASSGKAPQIHKEYDELFSADETDRDELTPAQLMVLAEKIRVEPDDIVVYMIPWKLDAKKPMAITRQEWCDGWSRLSIESIARLKDAVPALRRELERDASFKDFYKFVFDWLRESASARVISNETAVTMWPLLYAKRPFPVLNDWIEFIANVNGKPIRKDVWHMTLDFATSDVNQYDDEGSWPSLMDDFVKWYTERKGKK